MRPLARVSRNGAAAENLYEIQGPHASGNYGDYEWLDGVSRARQDWIAYRMFLARGDQPWRPYDGCAGGLRLMAVIRERFKVGSVTGHPDLRHELELQLPARDHVLQRSRHGRLSPRDPDVQPVGSP